MPSEVVVDTFGESPEERPPIHRFICAVCSLIFMFSLCVKFLQGKRAGIIERGKTDSSVKVAFELFEMAMEEFATVGMTGLFLIVLRMNPLTDDLLAKVAEMPFVGGPAKIDEELIGEAVENIHCFIFLFIFYYLLQVYMLWWFLRIWYEWGYGFFGGGPGWKNEERIALENYGDPDRESDTPYSRLRWAFFNPTMHNAGINGVGVDHFRDQFDALNLNFRKYLTNVCVKAVQEIVVLPKGLIGVPIAGVPLLDFWWHELSETEDVDTVEDLYMTMTCSWSMLFFAVLLRWQIRRVYKQVFRAERLTQGGMGGS